MVDFIAKNLAGAQEEALEWAKFEKWIPNLATFVRIKQRLSAAHIDTHKKDDITDAFCSHILQGRVGSRDTLKQGSVSKERLPWVMWDVESRARDVASLQLCNIEFCLFNTSKANKNRSHNVTP